MSRSTGAGLSSRAAEQNTSFILEPIAQVIAAALWRQSGGPAERGRHATSSSTTTIFSASNPPPGYDICGVRAARQCRGCAPMAIFAGGDWRSSDRPDPSGSSPIRFRRAIGIKPHDFRCGRADRSQISALSGPHRSVRYRRISGTIERNEVYSHRNLWPLLDSQFAMCGRRRGRLRWD